MKTFTKSILGIASVGTLLLAGNLQAAEHTPVWAAPDEPRGNRQAVSYADLNLASPEGLATMHERIAAAAANVCGPTNYHEAGGLRLAHRNLECRKEAIAAAISQLPASQLASTD